MADGIKNISMDEIKLIIEETHSKLRQQYFVPFFESLKGKYQVGMVKSNSPKIIVKQIKTPQDLEGIPSHSPGFYVILTDYKNGYAEQNLCTLLLNEYPNVRAIYRGEAYNVRLRLMSHLFNEHYEMERKEDIEKNVKRDDNYTVCLKLEGSSNEGINLDEDDELAKSKWFVAYHGMRFSDGYIRKVAEDAFDIVFGKPLSSRE